MSFSSNYNFITGLQAYGCSNPTPEMWATTFIPAVAPALIEFAGFGCRDIMKFRLGIGAPCGRALKAQVAKATPPKLAQGAGNLLKFEAQFSHAGFWFMIADLALDTAARWASLAYQFTDCGILKNQASWKYSPLAPAFMPAGVARPVAGNIVNYQGDFGHATIVGAVAPAGWYFQGSFQVETQVLFSNLPGAVETWIEEKNGSSFDWPANVFNPSYFQDEVQGGYMLSTQNLHGVRPTEYIMWARCEKDSFLLLTDGNMSVSELPPLQLYLSPLDCWKANSADRREDPRGANKRGKQPNVLDPWLKQLPKVPRRGPRGGMPRGKK